MIFLSICFSLQQFSHMKSQIEEGNCQSLLGKLTKGSIQQRASSLRRLLSLYEGGRSRIYLYERRITECLELSLLIEEKDISLNALTLLQQIIINTTPDSQIIAIVKRRLLSKVVLNLGSVDLTVRKISHKCLLEYLRKVREFQSISSTYLRTALQQNDNAHLRLKAINSLHSLLMAEHKYYDHQQQHSKPLLQQMILLAHQNQQSDLKRAALVCLILLLQISGSKALMPLLNPNSQMLLDQLRQQSPDLDQILRQLFKEQVKTNQIQDERDVPSPKFITIQQTEPIPYSSNQILEDEKPPLRYSQGAIKNTQGNLKISQGALKIFGDVSQAQEMLRRMEQTGGGWQVSQIQNLAPFIQRCLTDESIKLFSISKKIVEVILGSEQGGKKQYYVIIVPCVVSGITNKRFIVRKNLDKLVRMYSKNHTAVWVQNFVERIAISKNIKLKQSLLDLLTHAYKSSPQFYHPTKRIFQVFDQQFADPATPLKRKIIDIVLLIMQRHHPISNQQMIQNLCPQLQHIIIRKLGRNSIISLSPTSIQPFVPSQPNTPHSTNTPTNSIIPLLPSLEPSSPLPFSKNRKQRLITAEPERILYEEKSQQNLSQQKKVSRQARRTRKSQVDILVARVRKSQRKSQDSRQKSSLQRLPQLKKVRNNSSSKYQNADSPVKRSIAQRSLIYLEKDQLSPLQNPKSDLQKAIVELKDNNWAIQFEAIGVLRCAVELHRQELGDETILEAGALLLQVFGSLRSGAGKLALICLGELMRRLHRKVYPLTQQIAQTLIKKSITTSDYLQEQVKKCVTIAVQQLCPSRLVPALESTKESRSLDVKMTLMLFVQGMLKCDKLYKKQMNWIWKIVADYSDDPQSTLRNESRRLVKMVLQNQKDWKQQIFSLNEDVRQKIQKLLKVLPKGQGVSQVQQFQRLLASKAITSKYFNVAFSKFQQQDKNLTYKKNWKERIALLTHMFNLIYQQPQQFQQSQHARKYLLVAYLHIDQKNPGLLLNALTILSKSIQLFPNLIEDTLSVLIQRLFAVLQTKRGELIAATNKLIAKINAKVDNNKLLKQYFKLVLAKPKPEIITLLLTLLRESETRSMREIPAESNQPFIQLNTSSAVSNMALKTLIKLSGQKVQGGLWMNKLRQLIVACQRRFGPQFSSKIMASNRIVQLMS